MKPSEIEKRINKLEKKYQAEFEQLANEVLEKRIIPYCQEKQLSFMMMNGVPRLVNHSNEYVPLPKFMRNLFEVSDSNGDRLMYWMKDFKYVETVDFNQADIDHHKKVYANRSLGSLIFSPAFALTG